MLWQHGHLPMRRVWWGLKIGHPNFCQESMQAKASNHHTPMEFNGICSFLWFCATFSACIWDAIYLLFFVFRNVIQCLCSGCLLQWRKAMEDLQEKEGKFRALLLRCDSFSAGRTAQQPKWENFLDEQLGKDFGPGMVCIKRVYCNKNEVETHKDLIALGCKGVFQWRCAQNSFD